MKWSKLGMHASQKISCFSRSQKMHCDILLPVARSFVFISFAIFEANLL